MVLHSFPRLIRLSIACAILVPCAAGCAPQPWRHVAQSPPHALVPFDEYVLPNGLHVILSPDPSSPIVAVDVTYNAGSRNETPGKSGLAHFCEHMMFKGSAQVAAGEHFTLVHAVGGSANAETGMDDTRFHEELPANQLPLGLFLEADRMRGIDVEPEHIEQVRREVLDEKREKHDDIAYDLETSTLHAIAYTKFPYQHPTIGSDADILSITAADVKDFVHEYYTPNRAALCICGRFDPASARALVEKYFGGIPQGPDVPELDVAEPTPHPRSVKYVDDKLALREMYLRGYVTVSQHDSDYAALQVLATVLAEGDESPLQQRLRYGMGAQDVTAWLYPFRSGSMFEISCKYLGGRVASADDLQPMRTAIDEEIGQIRDNGITADQLQRALAADRYAVADGTQTRLDRAEVLAANEIYDHNPNRINTFIDELSRVTTADVQRVCRRYLDPTQMCEVYAGRNDDWTAPAADAIVPPIDTAANPPANDVPKKLGPIAPFDEPAAPSMPVISLPNGLRLILAEDHRTPLVTAYAYIGAGEVDEPRPAVALLTMEGECAGVAGKSTTDFNLYLERHGLNISQGIYDDYSRLQVAGTSDQTDAVISTLGDILQHPSFPKTEIDQIVADDTANLFDYDFNSGTMFRDIERSRLAAGTPYTMKYSRMEDVERVSLADMKRFWAGKVRPNRTILVIAGDFDKRRVAEQCALEFKSWKPGQPWTAPRSPSGKIGPRLNILDWPRSNTARFDLSCRAPGFADKDIAAFEVVDEIAKTRLHHALREINGDAYTVSTKVTEYLGWGDWTFKTSTAIANINPFYTSLYRQIALLRTEPVSEDELTLAKRTLIGRTTITWEAPLTQAEYAKDDALHHLPPQYWNDRITAVQAVTATDVYRAAAKYWADDNLCVIAIGPAKRLQPVLARYGKVDLLDFRGNPEHAPRQ